MISRKRAQLMFMALFVLAIPLFAGCGKPEPVEYTAADTTRTIEVAAGEEFTINLESNETTGFLWRQAEGTDTQVVKKVTDEYQEPNTGTVGAGGNHIWTFAGGAPGETEIILEYLRPWEPDASPEKTLTYKVKVLE